MDAVLLLPGVVGVSPLAVILAALDSIQKSLPPIEQRLGPDAASRALQPTGEAGSTAHWQIV